jgi:hypothetical protein
MSKPIIPMLHLSNAPPAQWIEVGRYRTLLSYQLPRW